ncbi:hypothetical protein LSH36_793g01278 [Paralvinella palmiformis]|uniref:GLUG domain-containing protein n=1 Tax=Paralvinella palmiformis TaxID=53620 RepID=A0AAD9J0L5_9ANNE|nr:hypothetical protein LSH36_793g01278 [Paralvinella palmiformis]
MLPNKLNDLVVVPEGKKFAGWVRDRNQPHSIYFVGEEYDISAYVKENQDGEWQLELYAYWINKDTFVLIYQTNGATSGELPVFQTKELGSDLTLAMNVGELARVGYMFIGWNTKEDGSGTHYNAGAVYKKDDTLPFRLLYAEWKSVIKLIYNANGADGGTPPQEQEKQLDKDIVIADNTGQLVKNGQYFVGWNTRVDGKGTYYSVGAVYEKNTSLVLYAEWTTATPITQASDFQKMRDNLAGSFILLEDIDLPKNFASIGKKDIPFTGNFYGRNHTLSNLKLINTYSDKLGFFLSLSNAGVFNLIFDDPQIEGDSNVGVLAGYIRGSTMIKQVKIVGSNAKVKAVGNTAGMLIGQIEGSTIKSSVIEKSEVTGTIEGNSNIGGMVGISGNVEILRCRATVNVTGNGDRIGGLIGSQDGSAIKTSYATGTVTSKGSDYDYIGGLVGYQDGDIINSYATGDVVSVAGSDRIGGLVGCQNGDIINSYATGNVRGVGVDSYNIGGLVGLQESGLIGQSYATGNVKGTRSDSYNIGGLVGCQHRGAVNQSHAEGAVSGGAIIGGLVGRQEDGTISKSYAEGGVNGNKNYIGGLVGFQVDGSIRESYAMGDVNSNNDYIGGLVGCKDGGDIRNSYAKGTISGGDFVGGFVGKQSQGLISNAYATGSVSGDKHVGGLIGWQAYVLSNCYFNSRSTGQSKGVGYGSGTTTDYATSDLTGSDKFSNWDFIGINGKPVIWHWLGTGKWPILQWQYEMQQAP